MGFYSGLCGDKALSADQLEQFRAFSKVMHQASVAFFSVSATNLVLIFSEVGRPSQFCRVLSTAVTSAECPV